MKNQIFIGGWANTGSRLVVKILKQKGYNSLQRLCNDTEDYLGYEFRLLFQRYYENNDSKLLTRINNDAKDLDSFVIKHGHLIMMIPELKKLFPNSIFIVTIRHPIDSLLKTDENYKCIGGYPTNNPAISDKLNLYKRWYQEGLKQCDYIVKLEDLLFNTEETTKNLLNFLECDNSFEDIKHIIGPPSLSVGRWKDSNLLQDEEVMECVENFGYGENF